MRTKNIVRYMYQILMQNRKNELQDNLSVVGEILMS